MEALKAIKIIGNQNDGRTSKYWVTKGFKFHARPKTGAYSCCLLESNKTSLIDEICVSCYWSHYFKNINRQQDSK